MFVKYSVFITCMYLLKDMPIVMCIYLIQIYTFLLFNVLKREVSNVFLYVCTINYSYSYSYYSYSLRELDGYHHHHVPGLLQTSAFMAFQSSLSSVLLVSSLLGEWTGIPCGNQLRYRDFNISKCI